MKLTIGTLACLTLAACGGPAQDTGGSGFPALGGGGAFAPAVTTTSAATRITRGSGNLPSYRQDTGGFRLTGTPASQSDAAKVAPSAGQKLFSGPETLDVQVGEFGMGFYFLAADTHTFIVGYRTDTALRIGRQPSDAAVLAAARTLTECSVVEQVYRVTAPSRPVYAVVPVRC